MQCFTYDSHSVYEKRYLSASIKQDIGTNGQTSPRSIPFQQPVRGTF